MDNLHKAFLIFFSLCIVAKHGSSQCSTGPESHATVNNPPAPSIQQTTSNVIAIRVLQPARTKNIRQFHSKPSSFSRN